MECSIVWELLPLYIDGLCSDETARLLEEHLKECETCGRMFEKLSKELNLGVQKEDWEKEVFPLKKIQRKLRRKSGFIIFWSVLFTLLLCVTLLLTYGQISKKTVSFEMLYEMCRMQSIGKEFAGGNVIPLYEILDSGYGLQNQESSVLRLVYKSADEYDTDMVTVIGEKYEQYFEGKDLRYAGIESIEYTEDHTGKLDRTLCISLKFTDGTEMEYYITLYKTANDKFLVNDYFGSPYMVFEDNATEKESDKSEEAVKYHTKDSLFGCLPNKFYDYDLAFARYMVKIAGERRLENDFSLDGKEMLRGLLYSWEDLQYNTQITGEMLKQDWSQLEEKGMVLTDVIWKVKGYDKNIHLYQYDWELSFTHKETGVEEVVVLQTYRMGDNFVLIEEGE